MQMFIVVALMGNSMFITIPNKLYTNSEHCIAAEQVGMDNNVNSQLPEPDKGYKIVNCIQYAQLDGVKVSPEGKVQYELQEVITEFGE